MRTRIHFGVYTDYNPFSRAADATNRSELYPLRLDLIRVLIQLCKRRESPCRRLANGSRRVIDPRSTKSVVRRGRSQRRVVPSQESGSHIQLSPPPMSKPKTTMLFCPFCRWTDNSVGESQRRKEWRVDSLDRHMRTQHLQRGVPFYCPYDGCSGIIGAPDYFADHCKRQHPSHQNISSGNQKS